MAWRVMALSAAAVVAAACGSGAEKRERVDAALREALTTATRPAYVTPDVEGRKLWKTTQQFYAGREYAPAWIEGTSPRPQMRELMRAIRAAEHDGLDPALYSVDLLEARIEEASKGLLTQKGFDPIEAGALDVWMTYLYLKYASDMADGLSDLAQADQSWLIRAEKFDPAATLEEALRENRVERSLLDLAPDDPQYEALKKALADHRARAAEGGWPEVPRTLRLKPGQTSPHVPALARRLAASGDYGGRLPAEGKPAEYTTALQDAVKRFQARHGLPDTGLVAAGTVAALNVPIERRIRQIELNLERWRWLPRDLGDPYVLVNIPEYRLEVREGGRVPLSMRVVVGRKDTPTPIFAHEISYLVFSPYWNVPPSIAEGETLPAVLKDPGFLERSNMEVLDGQGNVLDPLTIDLEDPTAYRFRQRPGRGNSLGLVKFMFPNEHNIYLHDTPADSLFDRATRSYSHGCVRVEEPLALARYLLRDQREWTEARMTDAMHAGEERVVKLGEKVPVYLGYWTARVDADDTLQFRQDVYDIDARQTRLLGARLARLRKSAAAAEAAAARPDGQSGEEAPPAGSRGGGTLAPAAK